MMTPEYCRMMARYNAWQNNQLRDIFDVMDEKELRKNRKAHFGSILATANHIMWVDLLWMSFFDGGPKPEGSMTDSVDLHPTSAAWAADRVRLDRRMMRWANGVKAVELHGVLSWFSGVLQRDVEKPLGLCITHCFNHQTHHRGQIHAMLTAAGQSAPVTDLLFMPDDIT